MTIHLLAALFLLLTALMAVAVLGLFARYLSGRTRVGAIASLLAWLLYAGVLGARGVIASARPPGPLFLLVPIVVFVVAFLVRHPSVRKFAQSVPLPFLIGLQAFRVAVELALYALCGLHRVPRLMTFEGGDYDILIGLTAPLVAWLYASGKIDANAVRVWSLVGIAMLANIVVRALLTFPGPLHVLNVEVPNTAIGLFPFTYLPGFLAPLALCLHVLVLRALPRRTDSGLA